MRCSRVQSIPLFASITDDWRESLQDTQEVNKSILESDPTQLRTDLEHETELIGEFLNVLDASEGSGSPAGAAPS
jgi:hypothetical protein